MEVGMIAGKEVNVFRRERRAVGHQLMPDNLVKVEVAGKEVVLESAAKERAAAGGQPARGGGAFVNEDGHDVAGHLVAGEHVVFLAVDAAVDRVDQAIASPRRRLLEERAAQNALAGGEER